MERNSHLAPLSIPKILVIEDNADHVELISHYLEKFWVTLRIAESGVVGLKKFHAEKVDLVILDYSLPDLDGLELLRLMRSMAICQPIVMMSTCCDRGVTAEAYRCGVNYFIHKSTLSRFPGKVREIASAELHLVERRAMARAGIRTRSPYFAPHLLN